MSYTFNRKWIPSFFINLGIVYFCWVHVDIPKGFYSERFLFERVIITNIFIPKSHDPEDFYPEESLFRNSE